MPACRECRKPIRFVKSGPVNLPVDATPSTEGSLVLFREGGVLKARRVRLPADQLRPRHEVHFNTCPKRKYRRQEGRI